MKKVRVVLFCVIMVMVIQSGFASQNEDVEFEKFFGSLGLIGTYYPEFEGELKSYGASLWFSFKSKNQTKSGEENVNFGAELNVELTLPRPDDSGLDIEFATISGGLFYPFWLGDNGVFNIGISGQFSSTNFILDGTKFANIQMFAIMPHLSIGYHLTDTLDLKITWLPKLGEKGLDAITLGVYWNSENYLKKHGLQY